MKAKLKKALSLLIVLMLVVSLFPLNVLAAFNDTKDHWAESTIEKWAGAGVLNGYSDGSFKPSKQIKRGEFFKVIDSVMAYKASGKNLFSDLKESDWYYDIILRLACAGIVQGDGGSGTVRGEASLKREEAFAILARVFNVKLDDKGLSQFKDADKVSEWAKAEVGGMAAAGYVKGADGYLRPQDMITRAEVVTVIDSLVDIFMNKAGTYSGSGDIAIANTSGAVLDNTVIKDLYVTQGVGTGEFTLSKSKVTGTMYVSGGGVNSIKIIDANVNDLVVSVDSVTGEVRVNVTGSSSVTVVNIDDGSDDVILDGTFGNVVVEGGSKVTVSKDSAVGSIEIKGDNADLVVNGKVTTVSTSANNTKISGSGVVTKVEVKSGTGTIVTVPGAKITVAAGAGKVDIGGGKAVEAGKEGLVPSADTGSSGGGGSPDSGGTNITFETDPYKVSDISEINLYDAVPDVNARTFGGSTQLKITGKEIGAYKVYVKVNDPEPAPDPDYDRSLLLVPELGDLVLNPKAKMAVWGSIDEYIEKATANTDWYSEDMKALTSLGDLEKEVYIIGFRTTDGSTLTAPKSIDKFGGASVDPAELTDNSWFTISDNDLLFVAFYPEPKFEDPAELVKKEVDGVQKGANYLYAWPAEAGTYDPQLDNKGIKDGTQVYACFDLNSSYAFTKIWAAPTSIEGYTKVDSPADMGPNTWCEVKITGSTNYSYVLVSGKVLFPVINVTDVEIGAPSDTYLLTDDSVSIEVGKTINLTALLTATGTLPDANKAVTWTITDIYDTSVPMTEFTDKITVYVNAAKQFSAKPTLTINDKGVRSWSEAPVAGDTYLGFTADVHFDRSGATGENLFRLWMESLSKKGVTIDYMSMLGDNTSAYASNIVDAWDNIKALMTIADSFKTSGLVENDNLFLLGNHERWSTAGGDIEKVRLNENNVYAALQDTVARMYETGEEPIETAKYVLVPFGPEATPGVNYGAAQTFKEESIAELDEYLATQPTDIPIFVLSHFPIHTCETRISENSLKLINVLNKYPNVIFLWGHNHSDADPAYDDIYVPGDFIEIGEPVFGETVKINFTYASAGAMNSIEYRSSASSTSLPGGIYCEGKGMLVGISGSTVNMMWYDRPEEERPEFKIPSQLYQLAADAVATKVWYGASLYRLDEEITESDWLYRDMYMHLDSKTNKWVSGDGWANTGAVLGGGTNVVILGYKGTELNKITAGITKLTGYTKVATPDKLTAGTWGMVTSEDGTMVFVIIYALSDGTIWLPQTIGGAKVMKFANNTITLWDGVDDGDASNWNGSLSWEELADNVTALGPVTTDGIGNVYCFTGDTYKLTFDTYKLTVDSVTYNVVSGAPQPFEPPVELIDLFKQSYPTNTYKVWKGYTDFLSNRGSFSASAFSNIASNLTALGDDIVIIGINKGLQVFDSTLLPNGLTGYGNALSATSVTSASAFDAIKDKFKPGTWFFASSGSASYVVLNVLPLELIAKVKEQNATLSLWYGFDAAKAGAATISLSTSAIKGLEADLTPYGDKIAIIGVKKGLVNFNTLLTDGMTGYGKALSTSSVSSFASVKDKFKPGTWFFAYSGSASYVVMYYRFAD
jgi:hypothetical protein